MQDTKMPIAWHLLELRNRLLMYVVVLIGFAVLGYVLRENLLYFIQKPLDQPLFYSNPAGAFIFLLKISLFFGFLASLPILVFQFLKFIEPALPERFKKQIYLYLILSVILAFCGVAFAYFVALSASLSFLNRFGDGKLNPIISTDEYFSFVNLYLAGFALIFQMPLIMSALNQIFTINAKRLRQVRPYVTLAAFIIAGILTPTPDPVNQLIMALPILGLYEISILVIARANKSKSLRFDSGLEA